MLKQILQILFLCFAVMMLTTKVAIGSPVVSDVLVAKHLPTHQLVIAAGTNQPASPPVNQPNSTPDDHADERKGNRDRQQPDQPATQADPSNPYDPYDYDAIRESNRQTYGEMKGKESD